MHTGVGNQAHKVQSATLTADIIESGFQRATLLNRTGFNTLINANNLLIDHATGTDILVPDFGIAHDPFGQSYSQTTCLDLGPRVFGRETVSDRRIGQFNRIVGIVGYIVILSPTITDDEDNRLLCFGHYNQLCVKK
jgi:hypothetical protein